MTDTPTLTLKDVADALGANYGRVRGFADARGVSVHMGAVRLPGARGVRYPESAVALFDAMLRAQDARKVMPVTAGEWLDKNAAEVLRNLRQSQQSVADAAATTQGQQGGGGEADGGPDQQQNSMTTRQHLMSTPQQQDGGGVLVELLSRLVDAQASRTAADKGALSHGVNSLLTSEEAAFYLACSPRSVSRYVRPFRKGVYRMSDVQAYINGTAAGQQDNK